MNATTHIETAALVRAQRQPLPSWKTMEATLRQWHEQSLNDPEYLWLSPVNFEDMADLVNKAIFCAADDAPKLDELRGFGNVRGELDALTVRRVGG